MINIQDIARGLQARRTSTGWVACCPAHKDHTPSFTLREQNGKILVKCHAGCTQAEVIAALRERGLWHEPSRGQGSRGEPADPDRAEDMLRAAYWKISTLMYAEWLLEQIPLTDPMRIKLTGLVRTLGAGDEAVLTEYRVWQKRDPQLTAGLVYAGRLGNARLQRRLARWIEGGMDGEFL